jgi:hypothetical protein
MWDRRCRSKLKNKKMEPIRYQIRLFNHAAISYSCYLYYLTKIASLCVAAAPKFSRILHQLEALIQRIEHVLHIPCIRALVSKAVLAKAEIELRKLKLAKYNSKCVSS